MERDCYTLQLILMEEEFNLALTLLYAALGTKRNQQVQDSDYNPVKTVIFIVTNFFKKTLQKVCSAISQEL